MTRNERLSFGGSSFITMEVKEKIAITVPSEQTYVPVKEPEPKIYIKRKYWGILSIYNLTREI